MRSKSNLLLLLAAAIWGFAFVAQRVGMDYIGPFTFNGVRFALGGFSLVPLIILFKSRRASGAGYEVKSSWPFGLLTGLVLFIAVSLQQIGLIYTTVGKAAFITGLYIVLVPVIGILFKRPVTFSTWLGSIMAIAGLYLLSVKEGFKVSYGDILEMIGAFFWAAHILMIDSFSRKIDTLKFAFFQFLTCSVLSLVTALLLETIHFDGIINAGIPILYTGICSVGIAYTLQIVGQKNALPSHAAIILSMETVFAAVGGYLLLKEQLGLRELLGCALMMAGMLQAQLGGIGSKNNGVVTEGKAL